MAQLHAFWWNHAELGQSIGQFITSTDIQNYIDLAQKKVQEFAAFRGNALDSRHKKILEIVTKNWVPGRIERVVQGRDLTVVHRDPHPLNFLHPRDLEVGGVKIVDWQGWRVDVATMI